MTKASTALLLSLTVTAVSAYADERGRLIFEDDFERTESQEVKEEIGRGWDSNSDRRAAGNKQVDLRAGAMHISIHKSADHAVSVTHPAEFRNGTVELRFMLKDRNDSLGVNFADPEFKEVWAGHLFVATVRTTGVQLVDLKTGNMNLKIHEARKAGKLTIKQRELLKTKTRRVPNKLEAGRWYDLRIDVNDDRIRLAIDGRPVVAFSSEGVAHPTKRLLRLSVPRKAIVDDVKIFSR